jgi:hypothetical protein
MLALKKDFTLLKNNFQSTLKIVFSAYQSFEVIPGEFNDHSKRGNYNWLTQFFNP